MQSSQFVSRAHRKTLPWAMIPTMEPKRAATVRELLQIAAFLVEFLSAGMKRRVVGRLFVVGAELRDVQRPVIVGRKNSLSLLDRFAERVSDVIGHVRMDDHRPAAEIHGRDRMIEPFEMIAR